MQNAAEQGNQFAQYILGKLYLLGKDVPKNKELAIKWLTIEALWHSEEESVMQAEFRML